MCGIAGYIDLNGRLIAEAGHAEFENSASRLLSRRGPDAWGVAHFNNENSRIGLIHTRLAIIDLSDEANQPFYSNDGRYCMVFNGEIYNYLELRQQLEGRYKFKTNSDTEVLLACFQLYGLEMFGLLEGMFAGAIYDAEDGVMHLFRDHVGIKPLYYHCSENGLIFSSEPKVIRDAIPSAQTINSTSASTFILFGFSDHDDQTFFNGVMQLKPGERLRFESRNGLFEKHSFYNPSAPTKTEFPQNPDGYHELITDVIRRQLRSDVQVGTSLSGGIDSGIIATCIGNILNGDAQQVKAITYVAPGFANDESEFAKKIAANATLNWKPVSFKTDDFAKDFESLIRYMEEPFGSLSIFAQFNIMKKAKEEGIKVMLDGQGGDELYLGYPRLAQRIILENLRRLNPVGAISEWRWAVQRQNMSMLYPVLSNLYFNSYGLVRRHKLKQFGKYVDVDFLNQYDVALAKDFFSPKTLRNKQVDELHRFTMPRLLKYADRNSSFHSIESRVPHLDQRNLNYALNLPNHLKIDKGWTKLIMRKAFEASMPKDVIWQTQKIGFDTPQAQWLNSIKDYLFDAMDSFDGLFKLDAIKRDLEHPEEAMDHGLFRVVSTILSASINGLKF